MRGWVLAGLLLPGIAAADGVYRCRWQPGASAVEYAASDEADVRALIQGAQLVDADGRAPSFAGLSSKRPEGRTAPLYCRNEETAPADGLLELTFSRRVSFGASYTLARCQLRYRCAGASDGSERIAPERRLCRGSACSPQPEPPSESAAPEPPSESAAPEARE